MSTGSRINIVSKATPEFGSNVTIGAVSYHVQTEDLPKTTQLITRIYDKGEVVFSKKSDYSHILKLKDAPERLRALMENQHKAAISAFTEEKQPKPKEKTKNDYIEEVKLLLRKKNGKSALHVLQHALEKFPDDPFLISYYGCLVAVVQNKPSEGIKICEAAIKKLDSSMPFGSEFFKPAFFLNLGRAHLKNKDKEAAIAAFKQGLQIDSENHDLLWELKKLGTRKNPPIPFLNRGNPLNKYIGKFLHKISR